MEEKPVTLRMELTENFLLYNNTGRRLFHSVARTLPIIDPHNHVDPGQLSENASFANLYQLWVKPDQYKSRIMRNMGVPERLITGDAPDFEKFLAWSGCLQHTAGNPMLHWSCLELKRLFGIEEMLTPANAERIWRETSEVLSRPGFGAMDIVRSLGVEILCTSDDLLDSLEHHSELQAQSHTTRCIPSLRGDSILNITSADFFKWMIRLQKLTQIEVTDLRSFKNAVKERLDFFDKMGCLLSDHSLDSGFSFVKTDEHRAAELFAAVLSGKTSLTATDIVKLQSHLLHFLGSEYRSRSWKMQLHIGAQRYTSSKLRRVAGPAGGYACIGNSVDVQSLCSFLDSLDVEDQLPPTILYTLNPSDNAVFASLTGSFSEDNVPGKIQFGPAWWFNDHLEGITQQLLALSSYGLLSTSIGMTTDSRSILSFLRHEYFRRVLSNLVGLWAEEGKIPMDWQFLSDLIRKVCYENCRNWIKK